jgi:hypothetical protein
MSCQTVAIGGDVVHINYGPAMEEIVRESEGERWCFHCRKRREFFYIVTAPVEPDWYGPNVDIKCGTCATSDGDLFPGREREWDC